MSSKRYIAGRRVCILTTLHHPFCPRIFHKQARMLVKAGYDVTLIAQHKCDELVDGVKIIALPKPRNRFTRMFGLAWKAFRLALRQRADIYHFHDPELLPWGGLLKATTNAKIIYDVHENVRKMILSKTWLPSWCRGFLFAAYVLSERICLPLIDEIVIAEASYVDNYQGRNNVVAIRNYPILSHFEGCADMSAERAKEANYSFKIVYVGGVTVLRGALELVEALRIVKADGHQKASLNLVGPVASAGLKDELDGLIQQYGLERDTFVPGKVPYKRVPEILSQSHVGMAILHPHPNYVGSPPTKLFEYMAAGLPVIVSNFPLWEKIVTRNGCGLTVDPLNPKEIAQAIEYLLEQPDMRQEMGEKGRRAVLEKYSWGKEGQKLLALYTELLRQ